MAIKKFNEAINEALHEEMERDPTVFTLGEDIGMFESIFATCKGLWKKYGGERVIDTPISESAIIGAAIGCAITGLRPVAELMFIDFTGVCMDQIVNQMAKIRYMLAGQVKVPMVIRTQGGAGRSFAAQHSQSLESWFMHIPGIKIVQPSTPYDAKGLLKSAIRDDSPVMYIEHKLMYFTEGEVPEKEYLIPIGKADIKKEGKDVTLISHSRMVHFCLEAAQKLAADGVNAEVLDLRSIKPLDTEAILQSVAKTGKVVIVDEGHKTAGVGAEVAAIIADEGFEHLDAPIKRVAAMDCPMPFNNKLEKAMLPSVEQVIEAAKSVLN
jgi:acetoin:2,6-dichlorophenolindophenol oxidoreductase subunit beta